LLRNYCPPHWFQAFSTKTSSAQFSGTFLSIPELTQKTGNKSTTLTENIGTTEENEYQAIQSMTLNKVVDFERQTNDLLKMYLN
jgi:hypothetical protein